MKIFYNCMQRQMHKIGSVEIQCGFYECNAIIL